MISVMFLYTGLPDAKARDFGEFQASDKSHANLMFTEVEQKPYHVH